MVVGLVAVLMAALTPALRTVHTGWKAGERRMEVLQNARIAFDEKIRVLRQLTRVSAVSAPGDSNGYIEFYDSDGALMRFDLDSQSSYLRYGAAGAEATLAGPVSSLVFTCYDSAGAVMAAPVAVGRIRSLELEITVNDAEGRVAPVSLSGKVYLRRDQSSLAINEIMYNPPGSQDRRLEWVELYNPGEAVDLDGFQIVSLGNPYDPDTIEGDDRYGSGETVLPPGGYAVITPNDSDVDTDLLDDGGFEKKIKVTDWVYSSGWSRIKDGDTREGTGKAGRSGSGWLYQERMIPGTAESAHFSCWEKTPSSSPSSLMLGITLRDSSDVLLATIYDGPMHDAWTRHAVDLTPYRGNQLRIRFETTGAGTFWIDDAVMSWSHVSADALRLRVEDDDLGGLLDNDGDSVSLLDGGIPADVVTYDDAWGGDGNGRTIERVSVEGDPDDPANWSQGPSNGTPGRVNEASQ
jgi:hypothetical protein